jgi:hypothetical protein
VVPGPRHAFTVNAGQPPCHDQHCLAKLPSRPGIVHLHGVTGAATGDPAFAVCYTGRLATGGCSAAMAAKSWMSRLRRVASQARQTWLGGMSLTWL